MGTPESAPSIELTLDGVMSFALRAKLDASKFYEELATVVSDVATHNLLAEIVADQKQHFVELSESFKRHYPHDFDRVVGHSRGPDVPRPALPAPLSLKGLSVRELLIVAMGEERKARALYEKSASGADHLPQLRRVLENLALEEGEHLSHLKLIAQNLGLW